MAAVFHVFISYAPVDEVFARELEKHLAPLKRDGAIRAWHQGLVRAGEEPGQQIASRLHAARIIVLLASADYLASDYLHQDELLPALQKARGGAALVMPVLVRAHDWSSAPYGRLALFPRNKVPVDGWARHDDAWAEVAAAIREATVSSEQPIKKIIPPVPRFADPRVRVLALDLDDAQKRRQALLAAGTDTASVDEEIMDLRRRLREGGRLRAGDTLDGARYRLLEPIGRGGFATVWSAFDRERTESVAVKVLHPEFALEPVRWERFFRGARTMAALGHEAVVRVLREWGEDGGWYYFVMELLTGGDLHRAVVKRLVLAERIVPILIAVGDALAEAHAKGIVHRDVKPANILLDAEGEPRLTDFDLAWAANTTGGTRTGALGSFLFAAPEQVDNAQEADARADVYGLGMTALFCLYGGDLPKSVLRNPEDAIVRLWCGDALKRALTRAIEVEPEERFEDARAFCEALREAEAGAFRGQASVSQPRVPVARQAEFKAAPETKNARDVQMAHQQEEIGRLRAELENRPKFTRETYKIVTLGLKSTGKTSLMLKWANPLVSLDSLQGTKVERYERTVSTTTVNDVITEHVFEINDWGGEHIVDALQQLIIDKIHAMLFVVDLGGKDAQTVEPLRIQEQLREFSRDTLRFFFGPTTLKHCKTAVLFINKSDLLSGTPPEIDAKARGYYAELISNLMQYKAQIDINILVGSAIYGHSTHQLFSHFIEKILSRNSYGHQLLQLLKTPG